MWDPERGLEYPEAEPLREEGFKGPVLGGPSRVGMVWMYVVRWFVFVSGVK